MCRYLLLVMVAGDVATTRRSKKIVSRFVMVAAFCSCCVAPGTLSTISFTHIARLQQLLKSVSTLLLLFLLSSY